MALLSQIPGVEGVEAVEPEAFEDPLATQGEHREEVPL